MKIPAFLSALLVLALPVLEAASPSPDLSAGASLSSDPALELRIEALLQKMTTEEKVALLGGDESGFNGRGVARLGIPALRMADGPVGVRDGASNAYPVAVNSAATWDVDLIRRFGVALAEDTLAKGKHVILGPCVGIGRFPLGGRNFEAFGEDPYLSSRMSLSVIQGVQSRKVIATVKHFACNDQEWERTNNDAIVDERTLREVHLRPFETAVKEGGVYMLMTAYNSVNGQHMSENKALVRDVLKGEWGFGGLVVSDWVSVYSTVEAANNGLDIEMPSPAFFGEKLLEAVNAGSVSLETINDKVRRHLRVRFLAGVFDNPEPRVDESVIRSQAHRDLALEMAEKSIVLLKNDGLLPLNADALKSLALVGPHALVARSGGGGSSGVQPWISVSPVEGLRAKLPTRVSILSAAGIDLDGFKPVPLPTSFLTTPDGRKQGLLGEYFNNPDFAGSPLFTRIDQGLDFDWQGTGPGKGLGGSHYSIRWSGWFTATETRVYDLSITSDDGSFLYIDDKLVADNGGMHGEVCVSASLLLEKGKRYRLRIDFIQGGGNAAMRLGWRDPNASYKAPTIAEAVEAARNSEVAIVCVGNSPGQEAEGADVADFKFYGAQEALLTQVLEANPNTIVVVYGGVPFLMKPWLSKARAVVAALFPGQEGGTALASLLLGEKSFSGKLPFSYIQSREESPGFVGYKDPSLKVPYSEGVFTGYRWYDRQGVEPLFPFGYGLSYSKFTYTKLEVRCDEQGRTEASVCIKNEGKWDADEVVQIYVEPGKARLPRPLRELKGFGRISLKAGECRVLTIPLDNRAFSYYDPEQHAWITEAGTYVVCAGASSRDLRLRTSITIAP